MFAFYTSLSKRAKYSNVCVFLTDLKSDTQWGRDHWNLIEAFVYSEFDMKCLIISFTTHVYLFVGICKHCDAVR